MYSSKQKMISLLHPNVESEAETAIFSVFFIMEFDSEYVHIKRRVIFSSVATTNARNTSGNFIPWKCGS